MSGNYSSGYPPTAPPVNRSSNSSSPLYAPVSQPTPPHLAHSRYSSADLYAIDHPPQQHQQSQSQVPLRGGGGDRRYRDEEDSDSDSSDEEGGGGGRGGGFGTYSDFNSLQRPGGGRDSRRISQAPTLSTLPLPRSTSGFGAGGSSYQLKEQTSTINSTTKLDAPLQNGAYETVAVPKISRDWDRGENLDEKNYKRFEKSRRKRKEMKGIVGEYWDKWVVKRWKIVLPIFIGFLVASVLLTLF